MLASTSVIFSMDDAASAPDHHALTRSLSHGGAASNSNAAEDGSPASPTTAVAPTFPGAGDNDVLVPVSSVASPQQVAITSLIDSLKDATTQARLRALIQSLNTSDTAGLLSELLDNASDEDQITLAGLPSILESLAVPTTTTGSDLDDDAEEDAEEHKDDTAADADAAATAAMVASLVLNDASQAHGDAHVAAVVAPTTAAVDDADEDGGEERGDSDTAGHGAAVASGDDDAIDHAAPSNLSGAVPTE